MLWKNRKSPWILQNEIETYNRGLLFLMCEDKIFEI